MIPKKSQTTTEDVLQEIKGGTILPVYLIYGDEDFMVKQSEKKLISSLLDGSDETMGVERFDGKTASTRDVLAACQTMPFFGGRKIISIREWRLLNAPAAQDAFFVDALKAGEFPQENILVIVNTKIKKTTALYKFIIASGRAVEYAAFEKENKQTVSALYELAKKKLQQGNLVISKELFQYLIGYTGLSVRQIVDELEKLIVYAGSQKTEITRNDIDNLVAKSREAVLYKLADTIGERDLKASLQLVSDLFMQEENPRSIAMTIVGRIRLLIQITMLLNRSGKQKALALSYYNQNAIQKWIDAIPEDLKSRLPDDRNSNVLKQHPYRLFLLQNQSRHFTADILMGLYGEAIAAYFQLISSRKNPRILLEILITKICGRKKNH